MYIEVVQEDMHVHIHEWNHRKRLKEGAALPSFHQKNLEQTEHLQITSAHFKQPTWRSGDVPELLWNLISLQIKYEQLLQ